MNCFKGCGFLLREFAYYKGFAIIFGGGRTSQTSLPGPQVTNLTSLHMSQVYPRNTVKMPSWKSDRPFYLVPSTSPSSTPLEAAL